MELRIRQSWVGRVLAFSLLSCAVRLSSANFEQDSVYSVTGAPVEAIPLSSEQIGATDTCLEGEHFRLPGESEERLCGGEKGHGSHLVATMVLPAGGDQNGKLFWKSPNGRRNASLLIRLPQAFFLSTLRLRFASPVPVWIGVSGGQAGVQPRTLQVATGNSASLHSNNPVVTLDLPNRESVTSLRSHLSPTLVEFIQINFFGYRSEEFNFFAVSELQLSGRGDCSGNAAEYCVKADGTYTCTNCQRGTSGDRCEKNTPEVLADQLGVQPETMARENDEEEVDHDRSHRLRRQSQADNCITSMCMNGASCIAEDEDNITCLCAAGFTGDQCEIEIDECEENVHDCNENSTCTNTVASYLCVCNEGLSSNGLTCVEIPREPELTVLSENATIILLEVGNVLANSVMTVFYTRLETQLIAIEEAPRVVQLRVMKSNGTVEMKLSGLVENSTYRIVARSCLGQFDICSENSSEVTSSTMEAVPDASIFGQINVTVYNFSATVQWLPPHFIARNGLITQFTIAYRRLKVLNKVLMNSDEHGHITLTVLPTRSDQNGVKSVTFANLSAVSEYQVHVQACNSKGCHIGTLESSHTLIVISKEAAPFRAHGGKFEVTTLGKRDLTISWNPPSLFNRNGIITRYQIRMLNIDKYGFPTAVQEVNVPDVMPGNSPTDQSKSLNVTVNGLEEDYTYFITLQACTGDNNLLMCSPLSPDSERRPRTFAAAPVTAVSAVHVTAINASSFIFEWDPPLLEDRNGVIAYFVITITNTQRYGTKTDLGRPTTLMVAVANTTLVEQGERQHRVFNQLEEDYTYTVAVQACTRINGNLECSAENTTEVRMNSAGPASAVNGTVSISNITRSSFTVTWSPPTFTERNGIIVQYTVKATNILQYSFPPNPPQVLPTKTQAVLPSPADQNEIQLLMISGLEEGYTYIVTIHACTNVTGQLSCSPGTSSWDVTTSTAPPAVGGVNVTVQNVSSTGFYVFWYPPPLSARNGIIRLFKVSVVNVQQYGISPLVSVDNITDTTSVSETSTAQNARQVLMIGNLQEDFTYNVSIVACNNNDNSQCSLNTIAVSQRTIPSAPKAAFSGTPAIGGITGKNFTLTWSPPAIIDQNGLISHYVVSIINTLRYGVPLAPEDTIVVQLNVSVPPPRLPEGSVTFLVKNLEEAYTYIVSLEACVDRLCTPQTNVSIVETMAAAPDQATNGPIQLTSSDSHTLSIKWQPPPAPERNGIISSYIVSYVQVSYAGKEILSPQEQRMRVEVSIENQDATVSFRLQSLVPASMYRISMQACVVTDVPDQLCSGGVQVSSVFMTNESTPSAPHGLQTTGDRQKNSITVIWAHPERPNGAIIQFEIKASGTSRSNSAVTETSTFLDNISNEQETYSKTLTGLQPGFNYTIRIRARTSEGFGISSSTLTAQTLAGVAERPTGTEVLPVETPTYPASLANRRQISSSVLTWPVSSLMSSMGMIRDYRVVVVRLGPSSTFLQVPEVAFPAGSLRPCSLSAGLVVGKACILLEKPTNDLFPGSSRVTVIAAGNGSKTTGRDGTVYTNTPLLPSTAYTVFLRGFIDPSSKRRKRETSVYDLSISGAYQPVQRTTAASSSGGSINAGTVAAIAATVAVITAIVIIVAIVVIWKHQKEQLRSKRDSQGSSMELYCRDNSDDNGGQAKPRNRILSALSLTSKKKDKHASVSEAEGDQPRARKRVWSSLSAASRKKDKGEDLDSKGPIAVDDFPRYVHDMQANDSFKLCQEYELINRLSPKLPHEVCLKVENRAKNRYANIVAYDETRVVLPELEDDPHSDYINANYLTNYQDEVEYIATQGPVPSSIVDFWRMVWENDVRTIAMVTNLEEKSRLKCNQYWPMTDSMIHGEIVVEHIDLVEQADFIIRTFHLSKEYGTEGDVGIEHKHREVKQFHYTSWPDHGVPDHPTPLLNYLKRLRLYQTHSYGKESPPIVVHCSAGVGRTGTLVAVDSMLRQARDEGKLDVFNYVLKLRSQRNFMVQTESQYIFVHEALVEALMSKDVELPVSELLRHIQFLEEVTDGLPNYEREFKHLRQGPKKTIRSRVALQSPNRKKNRVLTAVPYDRNRIRLQARPGVDGSDYINASFIDSYTALRSFIATQGPLKTTVNDFWSMIWEQGIASIVMLTHLQERGQESCALYWPASESGSGNYGDVIVKSEEETSHGDYVIRHFTATNTKEKSTRKVTQFHFLGWPERGVPTMSSSLLNLVGQVERNQQQTGNKPVVVHCSSGGGRTGVYCAISSSIERAKLDNVVDIFQTVKMMRLQRMAFVLNADQYLFIYRTVLEYLDSFDTYANFK